MFLTNEKNGETAICKVTLLKSNSKRLSHTAPLGCVETLQGTKSLEICESVFLTDIILGKLSLLLISLLVSTGFQYVVKWRRMMRIFDGYNENPYSYILLALFDTNN